jgi:hypothetical protein
VLIPFFAPHSNTLYVAHVAGKRYTHSTRRKRYKNTFYVPRPPPPPAPSHAAAYACRKSRSIPPPPPPHTHTHTLHPTQREPTQTSLSLVPFPLLSHPLPPLCFPLPCSPSPPRSALVPFVSHLLPPLFTLPTCLGLSLVVRRVSRGGSYREHILERTHSKCIGFRFRFRFRLSG